MDNKELSEFSWKLLNLIDQNREYAFTTDEKEAERVKICKGCEHYNRKEDECEECGCYIPIKTKVVFESCPVNKWGVDKESWNKKFPEIRKRVDKTE